MAVQGAALAWGLESGAVVLVVTPTAAMTMKASSEVAELAGQPVPEPVAMVPGPEQVATAAASGAEVMPGL